MMLLLVVAIIFAFFGQVFISLLLNLFHITLDPYMIILFNIFRSLISFLAYFSFFLLLFYLAPTIKIKVHEIIPGA